MKTVLFQPPLPERDGPLSWHHVTGNKVCREATRISFSGGLFASSFICICSNSFLIHLNNSSLCSKNVYYVVMPKRLSDNLCCPAHFRTNFAFFGRAKLPVKEDKMRYCTTDFAFFPRQTMVCVAQWAFQHHTFRERTSAFVSLAFRT